MIGELARRSNTSAKTLRFYERIGILDPPPRTASGYRDFPAAALTRLAFIDVARAAGLTLAEIRDVIAIRRRGIPPCDHVCRLINDKIDAVERQLEDLVDRRARLKALRRQDVALDARDCAADRVCEVLAPSQPPPPSG